MMRIGILGFGFMGKMHFNHYQEHPGATIVAVCDAAIDSIKNADSEAGNLEGADKPIDLSEVELYSDFGDMLASAKLDAVSITLPTFIHEKFTCQALEAGVHVLCEKPMGLTVAECDRMLSSAKSSEKILQIGHCIRFWPEYAKTKAIIDSGEYGKLIALSMRRLAATPTWSHDNWLMSEQRSGGVALDLHIHDTDFVQYLLGAPKAVSCYGSHASSGILAHLSTSYVYDDDVLVTAEGGWMMKPGFGFEMSFNAVLENATIVFDINRDPAFKICPAEGDPITPEYDQTDAYRAQIDYFIHSINGEKQDEVVTVESSRRAVQIIEAELKSIETGAPVALA
ncbi:MAG: Gfo/Idh/MocA family oxidoreductase [Candidatus Hinthialibacter antarcticus]|nr:Gfo/Idh/MocA family oxidoreductase [Candidatus Hinthialibacter antarcticus]